MKYILFAIICSFVIISCNQDKLAGYKSTPSGLQYKFVEDVEGENLKPGDRAEYHISFRKGDTIVTSSWEQGFPVDIRLPKGFDENFNGNILLQALSLMSEGDSLNYVRAADSIPESIRPPQFKSGDDIFFDIRLEKTETEADFLANRDKFLEGFEPSERGAFFKIAPSANSRKASAEDGVRYHLEMKRGEQLLYSTRKLGQANSMQLPPAESLAEAVANNPILEGLTKLGVGDSLTLVVFADSMKQALRPEWGFQDGDLVVFNMALEEIKTKAEVEKERKKLKLEQDRRNADLQVEREKVTARAEKIKSTTVGIIKKYLDKDLEVKKTSTGMEYHVLSEGSGPVGQNGQAATVHYSGHFQSGDMFDASFTKGDPFTFQIGQGGVIAGWDEALTLMKKGGKAVFFIPYNLGYGEMGKPPRIPAKSDLVFYIEVMDIQ